MKGGRMGITWTPQDFERDDDASGGVERSERRGREGVMRSLCGIGGNVRERRGKIARVEANRMRRLVVKGEEEKWG